MPMLHVKVEVFRPATVRQVLPNCSFLTSNDDIEMETVIKNVNDEVERMIPFIVASFPQCEEVRWEFEEYGQGHYITKHRGEWF